MTLILPFNPLPYFVGLHALLLLFAIIVLLRSRQGGASKVFGLLLAFMLPVLGSAIILIYTAVERRKLRSGLQ